MQIKRTFIKDLIELNPRIHHDNRGFFYESYNFEALKLAGFNHEFVQDNQSFSKKGVLRGLHFQNPPFAQGKLVRVVKGSVLDVAVDLRLGSDTFGKYFAGVLNDIDGNMLYVPEGFAHGFLALEDSIFSYKCTNYYHKESESGIIWNDQTLNINWPNENPDVSEKDLGLPTFDSILADLRV